MIRRLVVVVVGGVDMLVSLNALIAQAVRQL